MQGNHRSDGPNRFGLKWVVIVLVIVVLNGAAWYGYDHLLAGRAVADAEAATTPLAEAWPTDGPTVTPMAVATATVVVQPTATPLPAPVWNTIGELSVVEFYHTVDREMPRVEEGFARIIPGTDRVTVRVTAKILFGIRDISEITNSEPRSGSGRISVVAPPVEVLQVIYLPEQSTVTSSQQRWFLSDYEGLESQATGTALAEIRQFAESNDHMRSLATELLKYRLQDHLRNLGFTDPRVTVQE